MRDWRGQDDYDDKMHTCPMCVTTFPIDVDFHPIKRRSHEKWIFTEWVCEDCAYGEEE